MTLPTYGIKKHTCDVKQVGNETWQAVCQEGDYKGRRRDSRDLARDDAISHEYKTSKVAAPNSRKWSGLF